MSALVLLPFLLNLTFVGYQTVCLFIDRSDGEKFLGEIEQSYIKLTGFFELIAKHKKKGQQLVDEVECTKRCFNIQLRDVTVVEDVSFIDNLSVCRLRI